MEGGGPSRQHCHVQRPRDVLTARPDTGVLTVTELKLSSERQDYFLRSHSKDGVELRFEWRDPHSRARMDDQEGQ